MVVGWGRFFLEEGFGLWWWIELVAGFWIEVEVRIGVGGGYVFFGGEGVGRLAGLRLRLRRLDGF